jgi:hypothetical protein
MPAGRIKLLEIVTLGIGMPSSSSTGVTPLMAHSPYLKECQQAQVDNNTYKRSRIHVYPWEVVPVKKIVEFTSFVNHVSEVYNKRTRKLFRARS